MATIACFLLEPTGRARRSLRRYGSGPCPRRNHPNSCHDARRPLDVVPREEAGPIREPLPSEFPDADWPTACACGHIFGPGDHSQIFVESLFRRSDTSQELTIAEAPAGAMWWATWFTGFASGRLHRERRGNGPHLMVKTPGGDWDVDAPATNGEDGWERKGEPPNVTATPSIGIGDYHGWLRDGQLIDA